MREYADLTGRIRSAVQKEVVGPTFNGYTKASVTRVETSGTEVCLYFEVKVTLFADKEAR